MPATLQKLRPDTDLQCYFERPSAVAALSETSANGFTVSGSWRQQFDWAVIEWNRDNVFEHPAFRNLPDGDLSGLELTYEETRTNCMQMDCDLYSTIWPYLRIWVDGQVDPFLVPLANYATPIEGTHETASAQLELQGTASAGDYIGLAWVGGQCYYQLNGGDTLESAVGGLVNTINSLPVALHAERSGTRITLTAKTAGANWNRAGVYGYVAGARTESWAPQWTQFAGGQSPSKWRVHLDFDALNDRNGALVPVTAVRKMRWTYGTDLQQGPFVRGEFEVRVTNWTVTGTGRDYRVAGHGSRRIEDDAAEVSYSGSWTTDRDKYSGGSVHRTQSSGASLVCRFANTTAHSLYLGTRKAGNGGKIQVKIDQGQEEEQVLNIPGEDVMVRMKLGDVAPGTHTVTIRFTGAAGTSFYFDFLELANETTELPEVTADSKVTLATDWDTDHSISLAPERTAGMMSRLGYTGRANHYVGAMWYYELVNPTQEYASATIELTGTPQFGPGELTEITIGRIDDPGRTVITHLHLIGDTAETVAKAVEYDINWGCMSVRAVADGASVRLYSRRVGADGNNITVEAIPASGPYRATVSTRPMAGGNDGKWMTDLTAVPRVNRAARDWTRSYFQALAAAGIDGAAALSMELRHGDDSEEAGIAQRCPAGDPVWLTTPALQTNFSPASLAFWKQAYRDLATAIHEAGQTPYLQFGEVQWWYNRDGRSGMPYYDDYTKAEFQSLHGREMAAITDGGTPVAEHSEEAAFLPTLIGHFTNEIIAFVRASFPDARFEVLYPLDVNEGEFNRAVNFPAEAWTTAQLACLKTEAFNYTYARNLNAAQRCLDLPGIRGFAAHQNSHLIGIGDVTSAWDKEMRMARGQGLESVVLFALDQFCLIGYPISQPEGMRRSSFQG
jgi:hypothetical protein